MCAAVNVHELVEQLQAALACCPRLSKHRMQLLPDLLAVLCGLRPLVLLDYVVTSSTELQGLVGRCPALHAWPGCILELARCCCVAHLPALLASGRARLQQLHHDYHHCVPQQQRQQQQQRTDPQEILNKGSGAQADPPAPCFLVYSSPSWSLASQQQMQAMHQQLGVLQQALEQLQAGSFSPMGPSRAGGDLPVVQTQHQGFGVVLPPSHEHGAAAGVCPDGQDEWQQAGPIRRGGRGGRRQLSTAANNTTSTAPTALGCESHVVSGSGSRSSAGTMWPVLCLDAIPGLPALPTLNGWLLEYPAVYLVHTLEEAAAASKALSSDKLQLHMLRAQLASKVCSQLRTGDASHVLCAFSVPEAMHGSDVLQQRVQQLVDVMQHRLRQGTSPPLASSSSSSSSTVCAGTGVLKPDSCWLDIAMSRQWVGPQSITL